MLTRLVGDDGRPDRRVARRPLLGAEVRIGFDYVRQSRLMRLIAVAYVLFAILFFSPCHTLPERDDRGLPG